MPWMRRFGIAPTGSIGEGQRKAATWVYAGDLEEIDTVDGPGFFAAAQVHLPGFREGQVTSPGFMAGQVFVPGFSSGEAIF